MTPRSPHQPRRPLADEPLEQNPAARRAQLAKRQADQLVHVLREADAIDDRDQHQHEPGTLPGDERKLRGIPVVGARGVGGAIPGTRPGGNLR